MAPPEVTPVYFVDAPPRGSVKVSAVEFAHPSFEMSFVWWRNTWCVVNRRFRKVFESLDARLGRGETGLVWRRYNS